MQVDLLDVSIIIYVKSVDVKLSLTNNFSHGLKVMRFMMLQTSENEIYFQVVNSSGFECCQELHTQRHRTTAPSI